LAQIEPSSFEESEHITIGRATRADCESILRYLRSAFASYESDYTRAAYQDIVLRPETLDRRLHDMCVLVAVSKSEIVGTLAYNATPGGDGHLRGMAVVHEWHGRGIASRLLHQAECELGANHCRRSTLDTTAALERAISFYRSHGYAASGRQSDFFGMTLLEYSKQL
jgi:GNAT superfamily N-acetyltransferase